MGIEIDVVTAGTDETNFWPGLDYVVDPTVNTFCVIRTYPPVAHWYAQQFTPMAFVDMTVADECYITGAIIGPKNVRLFPVLSIGQVGVSRG